jgi:curved DNA-binding protein CbpA
MGKMRRNNHQWDAATNGQPPVCEWPECCEDGVYRAPKSRSALADHRWFCLEHVREYNRSWNYFRGMSEDEVEAEIRNDVTWQRPTWPLNGRWRMRPGFGPGAADINDPYGVYHEATAEAGHGAAEHADRHAWHPRTPEEQAMAVLELRPPITRAALRARYKALVKLHHPDANNGDKASEERFKQISQAYTTLLSSLGHGEKRL